MRCIPAGLAPLRPGGCAPIATEQAETASRGISPTRNAFVLAVLDQPALETDPHILDRQVLAEG